MTFSLGSVMISALVSKLTWCELDILTFKTFYLGRLDTQTEAESLNSELIQCSAVEKKEQWVQSSFSIKVSTTYLTDSVKACYKLYIDVRNNANRPFAQKDTGFVFEKKKLCRE